MYSKRHVNNFHIHFTHINNESESIRLCLSKYRGMYFVLCNMKDDNGIKGGFARYKKPTQASNYLYLFQKCKTYISKHDMQVIQAAPKVALINMFTLN